MRNALLATLALETLALIAFSSLASAQNQLPTTNVTAPKRVHPPAATQTQSAGIQTRGGMDAARNSEPILPVTPDPTQPNLKSRDWNAPGMANLHYMTDAQFAAFESAHPSAVFVNRCFIGQDPDIAIRTRMRAHPRGSVACFGS